MKVSELIELLKQYDPDLELEIVKLDNTERIKEIFNSGDVRDKE